MILGEARVKNDVHVAVDGARVARFSTPNGRGSSGDRFGIENAIANDAQAAGALSHEHAAIRKKGEAKRIFEPLGENRDANILPLGGVKFQRVIGQRTSGQTGGRNRNVVFAIPLDLLLGGGGRGKERKAEQGERTWILHTNLSDESYRSYIRGVLSVNCHSWLMS